MCTKSAEGSTAENKTARLLLVSPSPPSAQITNLSRDRITVDPLVAAEELAAGRPLGPRRGPLPPGLRLLCV